MKQTLRLKIPAINKSLYYRILILVLISSVSATRAFTQQVVTINGHVTDNDKVALPGVIITLSNNSNKSISDANGKFSIKAEIGQKLQLKYMGFKTYETIIKSAENLEISMTLDNTDLDEVVVVGYGSQRKSDIIGAISSIDGSIISERKTANVARALQGQIPGLTLVFSDGKPSRDASIQLRGVSSSIGAGGGALVLVDGFETDMNTINPDDIETVTVLKDASSTAVYGAKGAFGVVLITTKKPTSGTAKITYDGNFSILQRTVKPQTNNNGLEWLNSYIEAYRGRYNANPSSITGAMNPYTSDWYQELVKRDADPSFEKWRVNEQGRYEYFGNYDWHDIVFKDYTFGQQQNLNISGGSETVKFSLSGRYFNQNGIYNYGKEEYKQYNLRGKMDIQIKPWLKLDNNISFMKRPTYQPRVAEGNQLIQRQMEFYGSPLIGVYNPDGTWTHAATYIGIAEFNDGTAWEKYVKNDFNANTSLTANIFKDILVSNTNFTYFYNHTDQSRARNITKYSDGPLLTGTQPATSQYRDWDYDRNRWFASQTLTYKPKLHKDHALSLLGGMDAENNEYIASYMYREGIILPDKVNPSLIDGESFIWQDAGSNVQSLAGFFYRAHYGFKGKYLVEASGRYDGNSKFPQNQRWGFFPSASVGWRISEENFMKNSRNWLDNLKIRLSAGKAGNGLISDAYAYLPLMSLSTSTLINNGSAFRYTQAPSPIPEGLTWEQATTYDLGLDFEALNGRLSFVGDIYRRNTTDMYVVGAELPAVFGTQAPKGNYADLSTNGWETSLSWRDKFNVAGKELNYSVRGALWDSQSKITKYTSKTGTLPTLYTTNYYEGMTLGEMWGYNVAGLFESYEEANTWANQSKFQYFSGGWDKGDLKLVDIDGNNIINDGANTIYNHGDLTKVGNTSPRYMYSLTTSFNWNGWGLSLMWQGVGKRDWYPGRDSGYFWGQNGRAYGFNLPWQNEDNRYTDANGNTSAYWPRLRGYQAEHPNGIMVTPNDRYMQDASYLRLKNATIDYSFPKHITKKLHMESLRIYTTGDNLLTFTPLKKYAKNFDPEGISAGDIDFSSATALTGNTNGDGYGYPVMRTITLGLNVTF